MDYSFFQNRLQEIMESRGLTMKELADEINMAPATISRYLAGRRSPDLTYIIKLAEYFDVSIDWLVGFNIDKYDPLPREHRNLINLYSMATPGDRRVIQAVLSKYQSEE